MKPARFDYCGRVLLSRSHQLIGRCQSSCTAHWKVEVVVKIHVAGGELLVRLLKPKRAKERGISGTMQLDSEVVIITTLIVSFFIGLQRVSFISHKASELLQTTTLQIAHARRKSVSVISPAGTTYACSMYLCLIRVTILHTEHDQDC